MAFVLRTFGPTSSLSQGQTEGQVEQDVRIRDRTLFPRKHAHILRGKRVPREYVVGTRGPAHEQRGETGVGLSDRGVVFAVWVGALGGGYCPRITLTPFGTASN